MENNELQHYGVPGMKWGVRRYQNRDGSLTSAGKKHYNSTKTASANSKKSSTAVKKATDLIQQVKNKFTPKNDSSSGNKKPAAKTEKEIYEEKKQKALKSGSAKDILEFKGDLTKQEMQSAMERIRWEQEMQTISSKEVSAGRARADKAFETIGVVTDYAVTASKAYNTFANIYNAFSGTNTKLLPTIQTDNTKANRDKRKAEAEQRKRAAEERRKEDEAAEERYASDQKSARQERKAARQQAKQDRSAHVRAEYDDVFGKGSSSRKKADRVIYDVEWEDVTASNPPAKYKTLGQRYVAGYLESKKDK